jgi:Uma2 family endonuclease
MARPSMTAPTAEPTGWTYDEYARLPDDGDRYEVIRGEVCVTPGPRPRHQWVVAKLQRLLGDYVEQHALGVVLYDVDLLFVSGEFLRPDLLWVPRDRLSGITSRGVEAAPGLVVEVLSPGSESVDRGKKPGRYAEHGVPEYWLVDPAAAVIERYRLGAGGGAGEAASEVVAGALRWHPDSGVPELVAEVAPLFAGW